MSLAALILDLDGLMLDTEVLARAAWQQAAGELGFALSDEQYSQLIGHRDDDAERQLLEGFGAGFPLDEFRNRSRQAWDALAENGIATKPGLIELLDWAEERPLAFAVATSSYGRHARRKLALSGLDRRIRCIVTGDEVSAAKPAPDIFIEAARRLRAQPTDCIAVEDSDAGIAAAHAARMRAVMVPDLKRPSAESLQRAWRVCVDLIEVRALLVSELA